MKTRKEIKNIVLTCFYGALALGLSGCSDSGNKGHTDKEIEAAIYASHKSGQFYAELMPYFDHKESPDSKPFYRNSNTTDYNSGEIEGSQLNPLTGQELERMRKFFVFPEAPTHVFKLHSKRIDGKTSIKSEAPYYLIEKDGSWWVANIAWKAQDQIIAEMNRPRLEFSESDGLYKHRWYFLFEESAPLKWRLIWVNAGSNEQVSEFGEGDIFTLSSADRRLILNLFERGQEEILVQESSGIYRLPYALQVGSSSVADSVEVPIEVFKSYTPTKEPKLNKGRVRIATFEAEPNNLELYLVAEE